MVNAQIQAGENVLITGIGGGVALLAAQLCLAKGANVFVTSGSEEKIARAVELGVKGGVIYKSSGLYSSESDEWDRWTLMHGMQRSGRSSWATF
jgi:NADPH:quinone reductase-like Zn-dependent oxidoreductase